MYRFINPNVILTCEISTEIVHTSKHVSVCISPDHQSRTPKATFMQLRYSIATNSSSCITSFSSPSGNTYDLCSCASICYVISLTLLDTAARRPHGLLNMRIVYHSLELRCRDGAHKKTIPWKLGRIIPYGERILSSSVGTFALHRPSRRDPTPPPPPPPPNTYTHTHTHTHTTVRTTS